MRRQWDLASLMCLLSGLAACGGGELPPTGHRSRALVGGTVFPGPDSEGITDGVVLMQGGRIVAVGSRDQVRIPVHAERVDCAGMRIYAGFWNSHVHFMSEDYADAEHKSKAELESHLRDMLTRWGFVHAIDVGSVIENTHALRERIERGELAGPSIRTSGIPFVAMGGQPVYIPEPELPQLATAEEGQLGAAERIAEGADLIKLMTASVVANPPPPVMPVDVVQAVTQVAHGHDLPVFAHPTNTDGVWAAVEGGVDVLAHTAPDMGPWSDDDVSRLLAAHMSLVPTLMLWRWSSEIEGGWEAIDEVEAIAVGQVAKFHAAGGHTLFGTDVGFVSEFDPTKEYALLARAGLNHAAILTALTTRPATLFGVAGHAGRLEPGFDADVTVLAGDLTQGATAWSQVVRAYRAGQLVFER